jgi:hypothetical protein
MPDAVSAGFLRTTTSGAVPGALVISSGDTGSNAIVTAAGGTGLNATAGTTNTSVAATANTSVKATPGRLFGWVNAGATATNATAITFTDGSGGTALPAVIPVNCPAGTNQYFPGGIPFNTSLFVAGVAGGPTITVTFS